MADMENNAGDKTKAEKYKKHADMLKKSYFKNLYNPETGWLAWWKSEDGTMHDYASPVINGLAIDYGLVDRKEGKDILKKLFEKMEETGFKRIELGLPSTLIPVKRADYLLPDAIGCPKKEDGTDTFGKYMNGGISAGHSLHFISALYLCGMKAEADSVLALMLKRQSQVGFQNGVTDAGDKGIDWTDWNGNPTGYEGCLAESFRFLQSVLIKEPEMRKMLYYPLDGE